MGLTGVVVRQAAQIWMVDKYGDLHLAVLLYAVGSRATIA